MMQFTIAGWRVKKADAENYKVDGEFAIDNIVNSKFSFVSSSSTSGFKVPSSDIVSYFSKEDKWKDLDSRRFNGRRNVFLRKFYMVIHIKDLLLIF